MTELATTADASSTSKPRRSEAVPGLASRILHFVLPPLGVAAAVVGVWLFVTYQLLRDDQRAFLPPPHEVVSRGFLEWDRLQPILEGLARTTWVAVAGLGIAFVIGTLAATLMSQASWVERTLYPYAVILQTIPLVAIAPIIGLKMGFSNNSRIVITVMISMFPIIANTLFGLKSATSAQHDLFALHQAGRLTRLRKLQFPAALPAIFTGLRISAGLSVIGAIVGEFFFRAGDPASAGLGRQLSVYQNQQRTHLVITALFFSCLLGIALFTVFTIIGTQVTKSWSDTAQRPLRPPSSRAPFEDRRLDVDT
jgi:NitT/TauT family transport system permease protein